MNSTNKNNSNVVESENIIELKNITKQYEDLVVLDNLNLDIKKNEFLTLLDKRKRSNSINRTFWMWKNYDFKDNRWF